MIGISFSGLLITILISLTLVDCESQDLSVTSSSSSSSRLSGKQSNGKSVCRYNKGPWSECANGEKSRVDTLRAPAPGCEPTRTATKKCKPVCRYSKSDWTPCENGEKKRTLTRLEGDGPECEQSKIITKQCANQGTGKKPKQPRNKNRKSNSSTTTVTQSQTN